jgi:hypothetical protein
MKRAEVATVSDDHPAADGGAPAHDSPVEISPLVSDDSRVIEGSRGMYLDPRQVPMTLMQPSMDAGQPAAIDAGQPVAPATPETPSPQAQSETE